MVYEGIYFIAIKEEFSICYLISNIYIIITLKYINGHWVFVFIASSAFTSNVQAETQNSKFIKDGTGKLVSVEEMQKYMNYVPGTNTNLEINNLISSQINQTLIATSPIQIAPSVDSGDGGGGSNVGCAWPYTYTNSTSINCYGYASM